MGGWQGQILRVNLTKGTTKKEKLDPKLARAYIGGGGLGSKKPVGEGSAAGGPLMPNHQPTKSTPRRAPPPPMWARASLGSSFSFLTVPLVRLTRRICPCQPPIRLSPP